GFTINFARSMDTVREDLAAVRPTILLCVPRVWEKMREGVLKAVESAAPRRRILFAWALAAGRERFRAKVEHRRLGFWALFLALLADLFVGRAVRRRLGLDRAHFLVSGAAPLLPEVSEFFGALGMPILEAYGQTECTGVSHGTIPAIGVKPGSVGQKLTGIDVRLGADGEILVRGGNVFMGYYK